MFDTKSPQNLEQALQIALAVQEAEKQQKFNEGFCTRFENSVRLVSRSQGRRTARTVSLGTQLKHTQRVMCVVSTVKLRVAMASQHRRK